MSVHCANCKEQGKTGEWNVSISSMDCIPTTTIFVTGGYAKVENNKLNTLKLLSRLKNTWFKAQFHPERN